MSKKKKLEITMHVAKYIYNCSYKMNSLLYNLCYLISIGRILAGLKRSDILNWYGEIVWKDERTECPQRTMYATYFSTDTSRLSTCIFLEGRCGQPNHFPGLATRKWLDSERQVTIGIMVITWSRRRHSVHANVTALNGRSRLWNVLRVTRPRTRHQDSDVTKVDPRSVKLLCKQILGSN